MERAQALTEAQPSDCPPRSALALAALTHVPKERTVELWLAPLTGEAPVRVAKLRRAADTPVSAVAVPGTDAIAVVTSPRRERDLTWSGELAVVSTSSAESTSGASRVLLENVHAGAAPVASPAGMIYAVRGKRGPERGDRDPSSGYRGDELELVAVEARSGTTRVLAKEIGDAVIPIGVSGHELVVYRVGTAPAMKTTTTRPGAETDLVAIDTTTGAARTLLSPTPPLARDFTFDASSKKLWFTAIHDPTPQKTHRAPASDTTHGNKAPVESADAFNSRDANDDRKRSWAVYLFDLQSRRLTVVTTDSSIGLTPHLFPGGKVAYSCTRGGAPGSPSSLCVQADGDSGGVDVLQPLGPGRHELRHVACTSEGPIAFGVYEPSDKRDARRSSPFPVPFAWDPETPHGQRLALPPGRVVFAGAVAAPRRPDRRPSAR